MLKNYKNGNDLITLDIRTRQLRYCHDIDKQGAIDFLPLSSADIEGYKYLLEHDKEAVINCLKSDIWEFLGIKVKEIKEV